MDTTAAHGIPHAFGRRDPPRDPGQIPNYELLEFINAGGFGDVWLARECVTDLRRAIKVLHKDAAARAARDIEGVKRYQQSAHSHPNLLQILTVGENDRCFYYVMEAADNKLSGTVARYEPVTLRTLVQRTGRFDAPGALELVAKLIAGTRRLHRENLAHYDLKPENILIVEGRPKIADVGLVAPVDTTAPKYGTRAYMTPQGQADDRYALGKILYELITGRPASDFPHLPPDLLVHPTRELSAAVKIVNRACHPEPSGRFASIGDLADAINRALSPPRRPSVRAKLTGVAVVALALPVFYGILGLARPSSETQEQPRLVYQQILEPPSADEFEFVRLLTPLSRVPTFPFLQLSGTPLAKPATYACALAQPTENFVVDAHLRFRRPWGNLALSVAPDKEGRGRVRVLLKGQPAGLGLRTSLGAFRDGMLDQFAESILYHPQAGLEYIVRLARCDDEVLLAMWPLARASSKPIITAIELPDPPPVARFLLLGASTEDPNASVQLLGLRASSWSRPWERARAISTLPALVEQRAKGTVRPAFVPPLPDTRTILDENLLAGEYHPFDSTWWMPIGNWCWWKRMNPEDRPKEIISVPFSREQREEYRTAGLYDGFQMLRFDRAAYTDFRAKLTVRLADPTVDETEKYDPFPASSSAGVVGLAFRLQDQAPPGCAWGAGYVASVHLEPNSRLAPSANVHRWDGLMHRPLDGFSVHWRSESLLRGATNIAARAQFFGPDGFTLTIEARGPEIKLFVNDVLAVEARDPNPDYYKRGRIALFASRLIATFESLVISPLHEP